MEKRVIFADIFPVRIVPYLTPRLQYVTFQVCHIRSVTMAEKERELNLAASRLVFLSDYLQFTTAEMKLNTKTFQWHAKMPKVRGHV